MRYTAMDLVSNMSNSELTSTYQEIQEIRKSDDPNSAEESDNLSQLTEQFQGNNSLDYVDRLGHVKDLVERELLRRVEIGRF